MIRFATVAAACVLAISSTSALAAAQSSATITGLSFTLYDLSPRDGITPSFSFLSQAGATLLSFNATDSQLGESDSASRKRVGTFTFSGEYLSDLTNVGASASVSNTALTANGFASGPQTSYNASASTGSTYGSYPYYPLNLQVSANSLLVIEANVALSAAAYNGQACNYYYYYCNSTEASQATASLTLSYGYSQGNTSVSVNDGQSLSVSANARGAGYGYTWVYNPYTGYYNEVYLSSPATNESKSLNEVLSVAFMNTSTTSQSASLNLSTSVSGYATTPVPEPETYALALAGLGVAGLVARRRRA